MVHLLDGGGGGTDANGVGVIPFCAPENEGLHKILQPFLRGSCFLVHYIFLPTKENSTEGTNNKSNLLSK